jgi:hypothetical protein
METIALARLPVSGWKLGAPGHRGFQDPVWLSFRLAMMAEEPGSRLRKPGSLCRTATGFKTGCEMASKGAALQAGGICKAFL